ncbi:acetoacetate--CoA ligase [Cryptosporangium aurantiacum]|uniref:Acetoacetyl-CoA synthetase n=1 Tax=Cryptosporangium aurantiacum TaxID=134849 RepID=A0A1M7RP77_9ACTN|nr:acetoacetate--CoA ligase [Cryptosporangium aurantiacum]SHN47960.1 acetoacetyl-CoA synthetase [Cryptosporangium aurantiacum]
MDVTEGALLWSPSDQVQARAHITAYQSRIGLDGDYDTLWQWSVTDLEGFWNSIWTHFDVLGFHANGPVVTGHEMPDVHWFAGSTLNYARNALRHDPARVALIATDESGERRPITYGELNREVARVAAGLRELGVGQGDRVAAYLPNIPEAVIGFLATASLGAIWSSCSPDFGVSAVVDRFAQIEPAVLLAVDEYRYNGRSFDRSDAVASIAAALPNLRALVLVADLDAVPGTAAVSWASLGAGTSAREPEFTEVPFEHPLWVLYSSGTTGLPKPIVQGHGGIVLEHLKELSLHVDVGQDDTLFWFTTTGWMMWNLLVGGLLVGSTTVLYDGSPAHPDPLALWRLAADTRITHFGVSAAFLTAGAKQDLRPADELDLSALRFVGSTGSPLPPEGFAWVYERVGSDVLLGSVSGGTDVCTAFLGSVPLLPVRAGVLPCRQLGARVEAYDPAGKPLVDEVGELVVTAPMPSMPVMFWNDADRSRYREAYFDMFPGVWRHGDWVRIRPDGGAVVYGRSDSTLNRGGVRMGTADFYRIVEGFAEIADSLVVDTGQLGSEGRLLLFVVPAAGETLDDEVIARLRSTLRSELSPRHVPDETRVVRGVPRTLSGKKLEVPVRRILLGADPDKVANRGALVDPDILDEYRP